MSDEDEAEHEHCFEEDDDEERTLSTDTYLNELDAIQRLEVSRNEAIPIESVAPSTDSPAVPKKPNPMILNLAQKFDKMIQKNNPSPTVEPEKLQHGKRKNSSHISLIQKQISLYEREPTVEKDRPIRQRSHRSVERMESMTMSVAAAVAKPSLPIHSKTKSCVNLKNYNSTTKEQAITRTSSQPAHAGALIVKENFIEPPKRVTKSFHGRTDLLKQNPNINLRFRTTLVKESSSEEKTGKPDEEQEL